MTNENHEYNLLQVTDEIHKYVRNEYNILQMMDELYEAGQTIRVISNNLERIQDWGMVATMLKVAQVYVNTALDIAKRKVEKI